jgi:hypothetical protein
MPSFFDRFTFDSEWYLLAYPDVAGFVGEGKFRNAFDHYKQFGKREGRLPKPPPFNEHFYLMTNPDVMDAVRRGEFSSGLDHFIKAGFKEGRPGVQAE